MTLLNAAATPMGKQKCILSEKRSLDVVNHFIVITFHRSFWVTKVHNFPVKNISNGTDISTVIIILMTRAI